MADNAATRRRWPLVVVPAAIVLVAAIGAGIILLDNDGDSGNPAPVAVEAVSIYDFDSLDELVAASDAIVVGRVVDVERGRLVGDPDAGGVVSRVATLEVDEVLAGDVSEVVRVEEEGWLPDGTPLVVNGVAPIAVGDDGVWFLDDVGDPEVPTYLVINSQGRYLVEPDGTLRGGDQDDPLVQQLQELTLDQLIGQTKEAT